MFGRQVTLKLKPDAAAELTRIVRSEIIPILQRQKGFRNETLFVAPERSEAIDNSFWDTPEDAEAYNQSAYPQVLTALANVIEEVPTVKTFDFVTSTVDSTFAGKLA